ncbi:MAG: class I SAM-dependent methyltransferase [Bryobacteraceae bacterium]
MITAHQLSTVERAKYAQMWQRTEYTVTSPGLNAVEWLLKEWPIALRCGDVVLDVGCGEGRAAADWLKRGYRVICVDHCLDALNASDIAVPVNDRVESCIWHDWPRLVPTRTFRLATLAYCVDVLEHLPETFVMLAVQRMLDAAHNVFIQVAHFKDEVHGAMIGETLHLTVKPFEWWRDRLADLGNAELVEARDCLERSSFLLRRLS